MARQPNGTFAEITWDDAIGRLAAKLGAAGGKVAVLSGAGPGTFSDFLAEWTAALGGKVTRWSPFDHEAVRAANRRVFGLDELPAHDFGAAKYIISFGADFLDTWLSPTENQRGFADAHGFSDGQVAKFVYAGARRDLTGLNADEWLPVRPGTETALVLAIANAVATANGAPSAVTEALAKYTPAMAAQETGVPADRIVRVAREFAAAKPSLAVAGGIGAQHAGAADLCAAVNLLNYVAGNIGQTVKFGAGLASADGFAGLSQLAAAMDGGQVAVLLVHDANPVYALPRASGFAAKLKKVPFKVSTSLFLDETAAQCDLLLPQHHALERWDDLAARTGVRSLMQPVMEPVFDTRAAGDILLLAAKKAGGALGKFTDASWEALATDQKAANTDDFWRSALQRGGVFDEAPAPAAVSLAASAGDIGYTRPAFDGNGNFVFLAYPHALLHDGRGANKPWLLENADPVTKITWHNWVEVSPETARALNVQNGEILRLTSPHGSLEAPAYIHPGLRDDTVAMPLGWGHTEYGAFAKGRGVNALDLLAAPKGDFVAYLSTKVTVEKTGAWRKNATVEGTPRQLGRGIAEALPLAAAQKGLSLEEYHLEEQHGEAHEINPPREVEALKGWASIAAPPKGTISATSRSGAWRSTSPAAPAARRASPPATPRTTSPPSASRRSSGAGSSPGCASSATGRAGTRRARRPRRGSCRCCASTAATRRASRSARCTPRTTRPTGSTARSTTAASAPATAPTTAPTRCGTSTGTSTTRWRGPSRSTCNSIRT
jgi:molybdopterin-containing oxidoreductase family iron-sulfur binding subunit